MDRFNNIVNSKALRNFVGKSTSRLSTLSPILAFTGFLLPVLLGVSVGWLGSIFIDYYLSPRRAALQLNMAANIASAQSKVETVDALSGFLTANPFSISAFPVTNVEAPVVARVEEVKVEASNSFETSTLSWTLPAIGAMMYDNTNSKEDIVWIGESFDVYRLTEVLYDRAIFQDNENNDFTKYLYLADTSGGSRVANNTPALPPPPPSQPSNIVASTPGNEGVIGREVIDNLMMNPFDEMKRFRIRPKFEGNEPVGLEFQWMQNDSLLSQLGMKKGDVIKSINGMPMKNMVI